MRSIISVATDYLAYRTLYLELVRRKEQKCAYCKMRLLQFWISAQVVSSRW